VALNLKAERSSPAPGAPRRPKIRDHQRLTFALLCTTLALEAVGAGMLYPLLARIQAARHLQTYGLGLMAGAYFFAALIAQIGGGRLLDGRRARPVLLGGLALGSASLVWFALAPNLLQLVGARAVGGLCFGIIGPAALRAGTVGIPSELRGARLGKLSSAQMSGIVLGPLAGSVLASIGGLSFPFYVLAVALGLTLLALVLVPQPQPADARAAEDGRAVADRANEAADNHRLAPTPATIHGAATTGAATTPTARAIGRSLRPATRAVVALLFLAVGAQLANGLYDALWSRLLTDRGAGSLLIGLSLSLYGIPFIILAPIGGRLASRRGPLMVGGIGLLVASVFLASYGFVTVPAVILVLGVMEAFAQALAVPGGYAAVANVFPDDRAATGQGWFGAAGTAAAGTAALVGAPVYAALGAGAVFAGGAVISAICVVVAMIVGRGRMGDPRREPAASPTADPQ
jgi:MFS family permease